MSTANVAVYLTVTEVARRWKFHPESVRKMTRQGRVPCVKVGRRIRVAVAGKQSRRLAVPRQR